MIIVEDPETETASTTRTLAPINAKIPYYFFPLLALSLSFSFFALITTLLDLASLDVYHTVPITLAFTFTFIHHATAVLYKWLHAHGTASIMGSVTPFTKHGVGAAALATILWVIATGFSINRAVYATSRARDYCSGGRYIGQAGYVPCWMLFPRGRMQLPMILAAVSTAIEMLVFAGIGMMCEVNRRRTGKLSEVGEVLSDMTSAEFKEARP
ncbi:hypothetical protein BDN70DRAFT_995157 [Pholiota conissans]|uniref:Uncharacterized protein n=1 Tax=Pholiota conissans TaxID=109636 RepID=A0A9P5YWV6_9AGAR|nr:hypothetical protein BDN70DRAFT_995157 [Pholiota conissans]